MSPRQKTSEQPPTDLGYQSGLRTWYERKRPVLWFCGKFGFLTFLYYIVSMLPFFRSALNGYLTATARISNGILHALGENSQLTETTIWSSNHAITVLPSCSALDLAWFFVVTLICFPAPLVRKAVGFFVGVPLVVGMNVGRIVSLYCVDVHFHGIFGTIHTEIWPAALILGTILLCTGWIRWAVGRNTMGTDVIE